MKTLFPSTLLVSLLLTHGAFAQTPAPFPGWTARTTGADKKDYLGEWDGYVTDGDGSNPGQRRMNIGLTIAENKITAGGQGNLMGDGTYKVSSGGAKFRRIDAKGTSGQYQGKLYEGIFAVEGNTLKWCSGNPGKGRPTALKTNTGAGHFLMVLTRKE
jgi:uncharacterized protein (TIGR03067 family)